MSLERKLAVGSIRRSVGDYSVYFATFAFCACLLYTFASCRDYLLVLDTGQFSLDVFARVTEYIIPVGIFSIVVFCFLARYANRFLVRRRKAELATLQLAGMGKAAVARVLLMECGAVALAALAGGIAVGIVLSPVFAMLAAWAFRLTWRPVVVVSTVGMTFTAAGFAAVLIASAIGALRELGRTSLLDLMQARHVPEVARARRHHSIGRDVAKGLVCLSIVYFLCWTVVGFLGFMIPASILACMGTFWLLRALAALIPALVRSRRGVYLKGLTCFVTRQVEAHVESSCAALTCASALLSVGVCALSLAVGIRSVVDVEQAGGDLEMLAGTGTLVYIVLFFGVTFMVSAAAVLALQQMSEASESRERFVELTQLGAERDALSRALLAQVAVYFLFPGTMAVVHDAFGFMVAAGMLDMLGIPVENVNFTLVLAVVMVVFVAYLLVTYRGCKRSVLGWLAPATAGGAGPEAAGGAA